MAKKKGMPGLSFIWKRALGITSAKRKIAKTTEYLQVNLEDRER